MLNAIRFVVFGGGGLAFDALTACRNVQSAPHVDPSVSAVDVTVNVVAIAAGVDVPVKAVAVAAPGLSVDTVGGRLPAIVTRDWGVKLAANNIADVDTRATTNVICSAEARMELFLFFLIFLPLWRNGLERTGVRARTRNK
jgi:hypothetical protein